MIFDKRKELLAHEFGIMYANFKFKEMLIVDFQPQSFNWENFPELFEHQTKSELFKFYNYDNLNFQYFADIALLSYINEGYRLKEYYIIQNLPVK